MALVSCYLLILPLNFSALSLEELAMLDFLEHTAMC